MWRFAPSAAALICVLAVGCSQNAEKLEGKNTPPSPPQASQSVPMSAPTPAPAVAGPALEGTVTIIPELAAKTSAGAVLFVMARAPGGPPVAVQRYADPCFPLSFRLGPESLMVDGTSLDGPLDVSARLDMDGVAGPPAPGDIVGVCKANPVRAPAAGLKINLDQMQEQAGTGARPTGKGD